MPNIPVVLELVDTDAFLESALAEDFSTFNYEAPEGYVIVNWSFNLYQYLGLRVQKASIYSGGAHFQIVVHNSAVDPAEFWYQLTLLKKD